MFIRHLLGNDGHIVARTLILADFRSNIKGSVIIANEPRGEKTRYKAMGRYIAHVIMYINLSRPSDAYMRQ